MLCKSTREEDFVVQIFTANTHTPVLFFSTQGLVYKIKAHKIPEGTAASKGKSIFNILPLKSHHSISSIMPLPEDVSEWKNMMVIFSIHKIILFSSPRHLNAREHATFVVAVAALVGAAA